MKPEDFFTNDQLHAYRLAQMGEMERLVQMTQAGVDLNRAGRENMTLLGLAVLTADRTSIINLMRCGANPNQIIPKAGSPAVLAIAMHHNPPRTKALEALFDAGYDPNQILEAGKPYIFFFVDYNHWVGLKLALQHGGGLNAHRASGKSLLMYMIEAGDYAEARELIAMGADVSARGYRDESALEIIEFAILRADPSLQKGWNNLVSIRELILSKLPDPKDRRSAFTDIVEEKIRQNPSQ